MKCVNFNTVHKFCCLVSKLVLLGSRLGWVQDPEQFEADGGWNFLDMEGDSGEEEEESEEGDPEFQGESDEEGASSEDYRCVFHTDLAEST